MQNSFKIFLLLAEQLNFSKAASCAFVSQQAISDHIRRLEEEYGPLFVRKPSLSLTPAGEVMKRSLLRIRIYEEEMHDEIRRLHEGICGDFSIGLNHTRAQILLPKIFPKFHEAFPMVNFRIKFGETAQMENDLMNGTLNAFLGVNTPLSPQLQATPIYSDSIYLIISNRTLEQAFASTYPACVQRFSSGVQLRDFQSLPMIMSSAPSTTEAAFTSYCIKNRLNIKRILAINDFDTQMHLCLEMKAMAICPSMFVCKVLSHNSVSDARDRLHAFPISGLENALQVSMITAQGITLSPWMQKLIELILNECALFSYI